MTPLSFDDVTCRSIVGDEQARLIEQAALSDADSADLSDPASSFCFSRDSSGRTYWDGVVESARFIVYNAAFRRRIARRQRKLKQHPSIR